MAWPSTRLTTYNPASKVKSADLNAIQDAIIKLNTKTIIVPGLSFVATRSGNNITTPVKYNITGLFAGEISSDPTGGVSGVTDLEVAAPIEGVPTNATILNVRYYLRDNVTGPVKWECHVYKATNYGAVITEPVAFILSAGTGADQTVTFTGVNIALTGGGVKAYLRARMSGSTTAANTIRLYGAEVDVYTP